MASYTANYGLHQWESTDNFLRTDFNTDYQLIDTALAGKAEAAAGAYIGTGTESQTISLGFTPVAVYTALYNGDSGSAGLANNQCWGGLAVTNSSVEATRGTGSHVVSIVTDGFQVYTSLPARGNESGQLYHYVAIG